MARSTKSLAHHKGVPQTAHDARSIAVARKGIKTGQDFGNFMSSLMSDLIEGKIPPQVANAACNAGGKLLKVVEMQYKYGSPSGQPRTRATVRTLVLSV
jgi:hypothetical protein